MTEYREIAAHRDAMVTLLTTDLGESTAERVIDVLLERVRRLEELDVREACCADDPERCATHGPQLAELRAS